MEYTADNLEKVVTLFYRSEAHQQAEAHHWLSEAQNSTQAWSFVWELLNFNKSTEVQFFAATTLHTKMMKHWNEVPEDHYELLKKRIFDSIIAYAMGPKIVLNRLCITLSAYIIHTVPIHWPNAFEELVSSFQPHCLPSIEPERVVWILLEILTVIPEEFQSSTLSLDDKNRVRLVLQEVSKDILRVVEMCLLPVPEAGFNINNVLTYVNASKCALTWIQLGNLNIDECASVINLLIELTCFVYWNKSDPECLSCDEMDVLDINVETLTAVFQHPLSVKYRTHVLKYTAQIIYNFDKILDTERNQQDMNQDMIATLNELIISIGDAHSTMFIDNLISDNQEEKRISFSLMDCILKCSGLPGLYPVDESSSPLSFGFWYTIQDEVINLNPPKCTQLILTVKPYYRDLACILLTKSMYPLVNPGNNWSLDDREVFRCYRQDVADTFMYCYAILNLELLDILNTKLDESIRNGLAAPGGIQWNQVETVLHAYGAVAECIECENLYLPKLMNTIKNIPFDNLNVKVMATALETVGAYSEWLIDHPHLLGDVLPLILAGLCKPEVSTSVTMALKDITSNCQKYLSPFAEHILMTTQNILQNGSLKLAESRRLMYSIGRVLSTLPVDKIMAYLNMVLAPIFNDVQKIVNAEPSSSTTISLAMKLKILSAMFSSLHVESEEKIEQPILVVMHNVMPLFRCIGEKYCRSQDVMEELSLLIKHGVATLNEDCKPLINDILQLIVTVYREYPQANILIVAKTILIMFGRDNDFIVLNTELVREIVSTTLHMCTQYGPNNDLSSKADVLEGFFSLLATLMKKVPHLINNSEINVSAIFQCAILCLVLPEVQTLKAISNFLVHFITQSRETSQSEIIQTYGESLVLRILMNLGTTAPRSSVDILSDIFLALNKKYCDNLSRWMNALLTQEGFPSPRISSQHKDLFVKSVLREKVNKRNLYNVVLEFTLICRGIVKPDLNFQ